MAMTKQQKILGGVVLTGAMVLGIDRLFLASPAMGPDEATASEYAVAPVAGGAPTSSPVAPGLSQISEAWTSSGQLGERLHAYAEKRGVQPEPTRDAFRPSSAWASATHLDGSAAGDGPLAAFAQRRRLMAIMESGGGGIAIIDGQAMRVGQEIDGFRLTEVRKRSVVFASPVGSVELKMAGDQ